jgi:hypothetical protein
MLKNKSIFAASMPVSPVTTFAGEKANFFVAIL